ncbi:aspartyl protease family protein [Arthrobacter sp. TmT3-37]
MALTHLSLDVVPDEDDPACATIWVSLQVGEDSVPFVLDSGARRSQVLDDLATDWPISGADRSHTVFSEHMDSYVKAPPLRLGDLRIENLQMSRIRSDGPGAHNLLGLDVLRHHSCLLDLKEQTLTLDGPAEATASIMPLYLDEVGHAYLDVEMGSETASAVWDTGAGITVIDISLIAQYPALFNEVAPTIGTDGAGQTQQTSTYIMGPVSIAGALFEAQKIAAVDLSTANATLARPMDLILGYPTLRQATWFIDFPRNQWALSPLPR